MFPENRPMILHTFFSRFILTFYFSFRDECLLNEKLNELHRRLYEQNFSEKLNEDERWRREKRVTNQQKKNFCFTIVPCNSHAYTKSSNLNTSSDQEGEKHEEIEWFYRSFVVQLDTFLIAELTLNV